MNINYQIKYLKYKKKYLNLKKIGGALDDEWDVVEDPRDNYIIEQLCCAEATQFPPRMINCEDTQHAVAAVAARVGQHIGIDAASNKNLDGFVRIIKKEHMMERLEHTAEIIRKLNFISDHDGINLNINHSMEHQEDIKFNIISFNIEGLCRHWPDNRNEFDRRLELFDIQFKNKINSGTILIFQELILKPYIDDRAIYIQESFDDILNKLKEFNTNIRGQTDTITSGIYWDSAIWNLVSSKVIQRKGAKKSSNAYLFELNSMPDFKFYIVNIHLKAGVGNEEHILELTNILQVLSEVNTDFKIPVYLGGDFNNDTNKEILVKKAFVTK